MQELIEQVKSGELGDAFLKSVGPCGGFDCRQMLDRCNGECCGPCPIPVATWQRRRGEAQGAIKHELDDGEGFVHVVTEEGNCAFKSPNGRCVIYPQAGEPDERADVCRRFGDESHPMLTCRWMDKTGRVRSRPERRERSREIDRVMRRILKRINGSPAPSSRRS